MMALSLLVNVAGLNSGGSQAGPGSSSAQTLLSEIFGKNRQVTNLGAASPNNNRSETESQAGSVVQQKINQHDGEATSKTRKGVTEELREENRGASNVNKDARDDAGVD